MKTCGRCCGDNWGPLHRPDCERGKEIEHPRCPRKAVGVIVTTIVSMDETLDVATVDLIAAKAVLRYVEANGDTGLNCAAENAYLIWSRKRSN